MPVNKALKVLRVPLVLKERQVRKVYKVQTGLKVIVGPKDPKVMALVFTMISIKMVGTTGLS